jgi:hypothetical protein
LENVAAEVRRRIRVMKLAQIIRLLTSAATRFGISKHALRRARPADRLLGDLKYLCCDYDYDYDYDT